MDVKDSSGVNCETTSGVKTLYDNGEETTKEIYSDSNRFTKRKRATILLTFAFILLCQSLSYGLGAPSLQQYSYAKFQQMSSSNISHMSRNGSDATTCEEGIKSIASSAQSDAQAKTSQWNIYNSVIPRAVSVLTAPVFGVLSDKIGRKPFIVIPTFGFLIRQVLYTIGIYFDLNIYFFIAFSVTDAFFGRASMSCMFVSIMDFTPPGNTRSFLMAMMILTMGTGASLSFLASGYLIKSAGFMYTMMASAAILTCSSSASLTIPETLSEEIKNASKGKSKCKIYIQQFKNIYRFYTREDSMMGKRKKYIICLLIFSFTQISNASIQGFEILFTLNAPLCWDSVKIGWYGLEKGLVLQAASMGILRFMQKCLPDVKISVIASILTAASFVFEAFVVNDIMMFTVPVIAALTFLPVPIMQAMMSNLTPMDKQGTLFASQAVVEMMCELLGSVIGNGIYGATVGIHTGIAFFFLASLNVIAALLTLYLILTMKSDQPVLNIYKQTT